MRRPDQTRARQSIQFPLQWSAAQACQASQLTEVILPIRLAKYPLVDLGMTIRKKGQMQETLLNSSKIDLVFSTKISLP